MMCRANCAIGLGRACRLCQIASHLTWTAMNDGSAKAPSSVRAAAAPAAAHASLPADPFESLQSRTHAPATNSIEQSMCKSSPCAL